MSDTTAFLNDVSSVGEAGIDQPSLMTHGQLTLHRQDERRRPTAPRPIFAGSSRAVPCWRSKLPGRVPAYPGSRRFQAGAWARPSGPAWPLSWPRSPSRPPPGSAFRGCVLQQDRRSLTEALRAQLRKCHRLGLWVMADLTFAASEEESQRIHPPEETGQWQPRPATCRRRDARDFQLESSSRRHRRHVAAELVVAMSPAAMTTNQLAPAAACPVMAAELTVPSAVACDIAGAVSVLVPELRTVSRIAGTGPLIVAGLGFFAGLRGGCAHALAGGRASPFQGSAAPVIGVCQPCRRYGDQNDQGNRNRSLHG